MMTPPLDRKLPTIGADAALPLNAERSISINLLFGYGTETYTWPAVVSPVAALPLVGVWSLRHTACYFATCEAIHTDARTSATAGT